MIINMQHNNATDQRQNKEFDKLQALCLTMQWECLNAAHMINYENVWIIKKQKLQQKRGRLMKKIKATKVDSLLYMQHKWLHHRLFVLMHLY